jgi:hypothetical protein
MVNNSTLINRISIQLAPQIIEHKKTKNISRSRERGNRLIGFQPLLTLPEHLSSPPVFSGVRVTQSLVVYVCFLDRCLSFCTFYFGHCVACSSIYGFYSDLSKRYKDLHETPPPPLKRPHIITT